ncbi:MAG: ABC transporter permease subunit, partial [Bacillota bacterium]|nr:ABC transporter permease subunit [Bacillota bacterium]
IPEEYYETARVEGCSRWYTMRRITLTYIVPTAFMTLLMAIINSFKIFREIYLLFGEYPHASVYMIQHYMNNLFSGANLQKLSAASTIISIAVAVVVMSLYIGQRRIAQDL